MYAGQSDIVASWLAAIVESSDDAIVSKDLNGVIQSWNRAAERMFGYSAAEAVGRNITTLIIPADRLDEEANVLAHLRRGEKVDHFETVRRHKSGSLLEVSLTVSPVRRGDGTIVGASKIARDITERKRLQQQVEAASRMKDEFLATLSHELRTPLNAILGYARILRTRPDADPTKALEIIERNAGALAQLVADVLDVSRIITGKVRLNVQACDLATVVSSAMDALRPAVDAKGLHVELTVDPALAPVMGDPDRLQQVFWNLFANAVKFTPAGGHIDVRAARVEGLVHVTVADTGIGFKPEYIPHMFERFSQADSTFTREHGGLGLGLALVRHFVELHGGTVVASSDGPGRGARFDVTLPLLIVQPEPQHDISSLRS